MKDSGGVNLRDSGFDDTQDESDFLHGRLFIIVKGS
jgi:hypothetical protein